MRRKQKKWYENGPAVGLDLHSIQLRPGLPEAERAKGRLAVVVWQAKV